jgi:hypothetical protein
MFACDIFTSISIHCEPFADHASLNGGVVGGYDSWEGYLENGEFMREISR